MPELRTLEVVNKFIQSPSNGLRTKTSVVTYREYLQALANRPIKDWTVDDLAELATKPCLTGARKGLEPAPKTIKTRVSMLSAFFSWVQWKDYRKDDPARHLRRLRNCNPIQTPVETHNWLTKEEVQSILDAVNMDDIIERRDNLILRLGFTTGLRRQEICNVKWGDVDFEKNQLSLKGKGDKLSIVHLSESLREALLNWKAEAVADLGRDPKPSENILVQIKKAPLPKRADGSFDVNDWQLIARWDGPAIHGNSLGKRITFHSERCGIKFKPHDMRRSFAGMLSDSGAQIQNVQKAMRHESESMTQHYLQKRPDDTARAQAEIGLDFD